MNSMVRILFRKALPGFISGMLVGAGFILLDPETPVVFMGVSDSPGTIMYLIYCGLYGAVGLTGTMLYDIEHYSLTRATLMHLLIVLAFLFGLGLALGWKPTESWVWITVISYIAVFLLTWLIMHLSYKRRIRRMNENLKEWKSAQKNSSDPNV